ncbi:MAG: tetratricopeptide repeat protein [Candidatus Eisenbacteria bacterium]|nr:tetratricopeptide repeat protein [Candidatus Eisenbacteria bacterium]
MRRILLLISIIGVLAYAGSFRCGWHLDDRHSITENEQIDDWGRSFRNLILSNRGLTDLTFTANHRAGGDGVFGYHLINFAIHWMNALLVFLLATHLFGGGEKGRSAGAFAFALFLLHPLATQSVTYIVQRYTEMATLFYLGAVLLYLEGRRGKRRAAALAWLSALAAVRCKEIALTIPLTLLWIEVVLPVGGRRERGLRILPFFAIAAVVPATLVASGVAGGEGLAGALLHSSRETVRIDRGEYMITQIHVIVSYLRLLVLPIGQSLDHDVPIQGSLFEAYTFLKGVFLLLLAGAAFFLRKKRPIAAIGLGWFFITLLVESSLIPIRDVLFEHRTYLPSVGFFLAAVSLFAPPLRRRASVAALFALAVLLAGLTAARNRVWRDDVTLWTDCVRKAPDKSRAWANLGYGLIDAGDREGAIRALRRSIDREPEFPEDMVLLAELLMGEGDREGAEKMLRLALRARPGYGRARRNLAVILLRRGEREEAFQQADQAVRDEPDYGAGLRLRSRILLERGDAAGAARDAERSTRMEPDAGEGYLLLARSLGALGRVEEALGALRRWEDADDPGERDDLTLLARDLVQEGRREAGEAVLALGEARFPGDPFFPATLGVLLYQDGKWEAASGPLERSLRVEPEDTEIRLLLARALASSGRGEEAKRQLQMLLERRPENSEARDLMEKLRGGG